MRRRSCRFEQDDVAMILQDASFRTGPLRPMVQDGRTDLNWLKLLELFRRSKINRISSTIQDGQDSFNRISSTIQDQQAIQGQQTIQDRAGVLGKTVRIDLCWLGFFQQDLFDDLNRIFSMIQDQQISSTISRISPTIQGRTDDPRSAGSLRRSLAKISRRSIQDQQIQDQHEPSAVRSAVRFPCLMRSGRGAGASEVSTVRHAFLYSFA